MNEISRLLTGRIIWLNSLRPVNLTDFPLKQHTVPNALNPKNIAKTGELPKTHWAVTLTVGGPGLTPSLYVMDILLSFFRTIQSPKVSLLQRDLTIPIV